jgi:hypothetical protein
MSLDPTRKGRGRFSSAWVLLLGDLLALLAFVYAGQRDHDLVDPTQPLLGVLQTAAPFALAWLLAGWWLGAFNLDEIPAFRPFLARSLNAWLVAASLGLLLRSYILGRAVIPTGFLAATLGFGGLFLLTWRLAYALARRAHSLHPLFWKR